MDLQPRPRLFRRLDALRRSHPVSWVAAPAGSGKTSLLVSYIEARKLQSIWYRVDEGDTDAADLFFYMRSALEVFEHSRRAGAELPSFSAKADVATSILLGRQCVQRQRDLPTGRVYGRDTAHIGRQQCLHGGFLRSDARRCACTGRVRDLVLGWQPVQRRGGVLGLWPMWSRHAPDGRRR
jgi:hypothetical protein